MLVIGGACDRIVPADALEATARAYEAPCTIIPGLGHDLMLDDQWMLVARRVAAWLASSQSRFGLPPGQDGT